MPRFVPRERKHKVLARQQKPSSSTSVDTNTDVLLPRTKSEKDVKRLQLRAELREQQQGRVPSKKQKRLDKYIEKKLRKDETQDLIHKLEQQKLEQDKRVARSASKVDSEKLDSDDKSSKRKWSEYVEGQLHSDSDTDQSSDLEEDGVDASPNVSSFNQDKPITAGRSSAPNIRPGGGLAQPLTLGADGMPVIQTRPGKRSMRPMEAMITLAAPEDIPWEGFDDDSEADHHASDIDETYQDETDSGTEKGDSEAESFQTSEASESGDDEKQSRPKPRASAFKAWATQQLNKSIGHVPSYENGQYNTSVPDQLKTTVGPEPHRDEAEKVISEDAKDARNTKALPAPTRVVPGAIGSQKPPRKVHAVVVDRPLDIQAFREQLPIVQREQEIMEAIHHHPVVIVKGDTGSGKTTQVPQFLYEAGYGSPDSTTPGMIGVTQPRRVAAISMANRVRTELGAHGEKVAHQVRFDSNVSAGTVLKFMTEGILMRELSQDLLLRKYSVIVIDEAHERSINTDILIGMLTKIVVARTTKQHDYPNPLPLKLVIMSATLSTEDFVNDRLFAPGSKPPIVESEGRQHRVTTHFALRSRADYVGEVYEKVQRAHRKLPKGGMLVFLTGQDEIQNVMARLREALSSTVASGTSSPRVHFAAKEAPMEAEDFDIGAKTRDLANMAADDDFDVNIVVNPNDDQDDDDDFNISDNEEDTNDATPELRQAADARLLGHARKPTTTKTPYTSVHVLPLYSQLPTKEQLKVFEPPPPGSRLIVLATNIAETSLTIPGIRYVFDSGRSKERKYNLDSGVQSFEIDYISKASAQQRAGRAGRTGPGHCWRLYSSAVYEQFFPDHAEPEILRAPAENVVLQLKSLSYPLPVSKFPFPTQPSIQALNKAETLLQYLGALDPDGTVTEMGRELSIYPLSPRLGKIIAIAIKTPAIVPYVIAIVAGLTVSDIFLQESQVFPKPVKKEDGELYSRQDQLQDDERERLKQAFGRARATLSRLDKSSDVTKLLTAVQMHSEAAEKDSFCQDYFLKPKPLFEVSQLRQQLRSIMQANYIELLDGLKAVSHTKLSSKQVQQINSIVAAGYIDQVAIRADLAPNPPEMAVKPKRAIDVPYLPLIPLVETSSAQLTERAVFVHPSSVLARFSAKDLPRYIVYSHLQQSQPSSIGGERLPKTRMFPLTPISGQKLVALAKDTSLLHFGKPVPKTKIEEIAGLPKRRECWLSVEMRGSTVGLGWPMPPLKVRQVLDKKDPSGWRVEEVLG